jgi:hypothetical protein
MAVGVRVTPSAILTLDAQLGLLIPSDLSSPVDSLALRPEDAARSLRFIADDSPLVAASHDVDSTLLRHLDLLPSVVGPYRSAHLLGTNRRSSGFSRRGQHPLTVLEAAVASHSHCRRRRGGGDEAPTRSSGCTDLSSRDVGHTRTSHT